MATITVTPGQTFASGDTVTSTKLNNLGSPVASLSSATIVNADVSASAAIAHSKLATVTAGSVLLGNASAVPTATALSGDVTINSSGVTAIGAGVIVDADVSASAAIGLSKLATGALPTAITVASANIVDATIVNADINASAAIAHSKLASVTAGQVLLGNASNVPTSTSFSGDVTINSSGVTAIGAGVIVDADISASAAIALSKLATGSLPTAITVASSNIVDGTIVDADISGAAAIALSKIATGALPTAITVASANIVDGTIALADLATAVANALVPVGSVQAFAISTAPSGWLAANGNTIGSASSGATNASADYSALFSVLWDNWTNTNLPILDSAGAASTRGVSASADFSANKRLPLPNLQGIFIRGSGSQTISGTNFSGTFAEKQSHQIADHRHDMPEGYNIGSSSNGAYAKAATGGGTALPTDGVSTVTPTTPVGDETRPANIALLYCIKF